MVFVQKYRVDEAYFLLKHSLSIGPYLQSQLFIAQTKPGSGRHQGDNQYLKNQKYQIIGGDKEVSVRVTWGRTYNERF